MMVQRYDLFDTIITFWKKIMRTKKNVEVIGKDKKVLLK